MNEVNLLLMEKENVREYIGDIFQKRTYEEEETMEKLVEYAYEMLLYWECTSETVLTVYLHGPAMYYTALLAATRRIGCKLKVGTFVPVEVRGYVDEGFYNIFDIPELPDIIDDDGIEKYDAIIQAGRRSSFENDEGEAYSGLWWYDAPCDEIFNTSTGAYPRLVWNKVSAFGKEVDAATAEAEKRAEKYAGKKVLLLANCFYSELVIAVNALLKQGCKITMCNINQNGEKVYYKLT